MRSVTGLVWKLQSLVFRLHFPIFVSNFQVEDNLLDHPLFDHFLETFTKNSLISAVKGGILARKILLI